MGQAAPGPVGFLDFLRARGGFTTEDVLATALPLLRQVRDTHALGQVAPLEGLADIFVDEYRAYFESSRACESRLADDRLRAIEAKSGAFHVVGRRAHTTETTAGEETHENLLIARTGAELERPTYLPGYLAWEMRVGHHDALADIHVLGLVLASLACGLDVGLAEHLEAFVARRGNLFLLNPKLDPVLAKQIVRMTEIDRHRRAQDLAGIVSALERYRDQDVSLELDLARIPGFHDKDVCTRRQIVLTKLRERLFEVSRRNRLLFHRPTLQTLNLTFASVPILFDPRAIRPQQLFTWQPEVEMLLAAGEPIPLNRFLRFEDATYLPSVLDKLISEARRDTAEFGFSQLRLVLCFLRWHNLKENRTERIDSPLLLLPVELTKKKGVRDSYVMRATSREVETNPVLRYYLKELYGISLPHSIDLSETTMQAFHDALAVQIHASEPGVVLNRIDQPQIELVYERARRRLDQYRRRLPLPVAGLRSFKDLDYSYDRERYQPLGLRLFIAVVRPAPSPLHEVFREQRPVHRPNQMVAAGAEEKERMLATFQEGRHHGNPYSWDFDLCNITLGNFNYRKMSLVRDYDALLERDQPSPPFDAVFSSEPRQSDLPATAGSAVAERFPVVACDPTQMRAIAAAEAGTSYIVQGPPGTGKSQTITNLIADLVAHGRRVLFVCEKRAAIDVVYHRLRQRGLHELVCLIHDSQADKREFVLDLKGTYERLLAAGGVPPVDATEARDACVDALASETRPLERFHRAMRETPEDAGLPLRALIVRAIELADRAPQLSPDEEDELPPYRLLVEHRETLERLKRALRQATRDGVYARHPLRALAPEVAARERPRAAIEEDLRLMARLLDHVASVCREHEIAHAAEDTLGRAVLWARWAAAVKPLADRGLLELLDPASRASDRLRERLAEWRRRSSSLEQARDETRAWRTKLERRDLQAAAAQALALSRDPLRLLKGSYWRLRRVLRERYDFAQHAIAPSWLQVLQALESEYSACEKLSALEAEVFEEYGENSLDALTSELESVRRAVAELIGGGFEAASRVLPGGSARMIAGLVSLRDALSELERLATRVFVDAEEWTFAGLRGEHTRLRESLRLLADWIPCLAEVAALPEELARPVRMLPLDLQQLEAAAAAATLDRVWQRERGLARFSGVSRERQCRRVESLFDRWLQTNAETVLARHRTRFLDKVARASVPSIRLSRDEEAFKRQYNAGRRELEHEFGKTMRYKSVRALLAGAAGDVILDLKPVWLMSPLSVSDTLPLDGRAFDVVVFDEASQVPLEEAVPALFRAAQVIVSGDQMQLPPTNFFSAARPAGDELLLPGEEEEDAAPVEELDANSFLAHAARNLPSTMLGWHYRSRSESLISFSNAAFYAGRLLTVPERRVLRSGSGDISVSAPDGDGDANAARVLDRPVSFHHLAAGRYEGRRNPSEAAYIARLVRGLLASPDRPTLGIVAFSEAQQTQIEAAIDALAAHDRDFAARVEREYEREEDGHFAGLLVKNLENIQGDERDVVLLSVCYGYGPDGRMLMNFGPINQGGGEKRLNVAFSRAKRHMAVVSSIRHVDIKNVYNDGANSLRMYLQYAAAMSAADYETAALVLRTLNPSPHARAAASEDAVASAIAAALQARGFEVERGLGHSHFRCDLAVKSPGDTAFRLAVFVDGEAYYRELDALERDVLRPRLLRGFGWDVVHVLAKDWLEDAAGVVQVLERRLAGGGEVAAGAEAAPAEDEGPSADAEPLSDRDVWLEKGVRAPSAKDEPVEGPAPAIDAPGPRGAGPPAVSPSPMAGAHPSPASSPRSAAPACPPAALSQLHPGQTRCFEFIGGTSRKYWHVTVTGAELVVSFGRIGTAGQVKRKSFASEALARREAEALIREKLGKGYQETPP